MKEAMTTENIWPPIQYLFFESEQPSDEAWNAMAAFAAKWNEDHESKFTVGESEEWSVHLAKGIKDPDYKILDRALHQLKKEKGVTWFLGVADKRKPKDFENAPFIQITGNTYPLEFVVNHDTLFGPIVPCRECGAIDETNRQLLGTPIVDESFLEKQIHPSPDYTPPGLDLIVVNNSLLLVSKIVADHLQSNRVRGFELLPVISQSTQKPSERIFLLRSNRAILKPCNVHTPTTQEGICSTCGRIIGGLLGYFHVREEWLDKDEIFSRHSLRYDAINVSNRLYHIMKKQKIKGLLPSYGIFTCTHK
jgi:hypothetical protein